MGIFRTLLRCFLVGLMAVLPLVITVSVVIWVSNIVANVLGPRAILGRLLAQLGLQFAETETLAYAIGWVIVLSAIFGLGVLVEAGARRFFYDRIDALARRVPVLGGIYGTARQLVSMIDTQNKSEFQGMSVVFCVFGQETGAAFLALLATPEVFRLGEVDYHAILIPTAPVPFGGSLIFVPASSVRPAGLSVDAFMSVYVSMGVTAPQFLRAMVPPPPAK